MQGEQKLTCPIVLNKGIMQLPYLFLSFSSIRCIYVGTL